MRLNRSASPEVERVFELPGRLRCSVLGLKGRAPEAAAIELALREFSGVKEVAASPATGRVLVIFDEELSSEFLYSLLVRLRIEHLSPARPLTGPAHAGPDSATRFLLGAATAVATGAAVGMVAGGVTLGIVSGLAVYLAPELWRRFQEWCSSSTAQAGRPAFRIRLPERLTLLDQLGATVDLIRPYRESLARSILLNAAASLAGVVRIASMAFPIDLLLGGSIALPLGISIVGATGIVILMGVSLGMTGLQGWLRHRSHVQWSLAGREIQNALRVSVYDRVQRLEMSVLQTRKRGELLAILVEDIDNFEKVVEGSWAIMDLAVSSLALLGAIGVIAATAPVWLMIWAPVLVAISVFLYPKLRERYAAVRRSSSQLAGQVANQLDGLEIIKSFAAEDRELERLREGSQVYLNESRRAVHVQSGLPLILEGTILASLVFTYRANVLLTLAKGGSMGSFQALNIFTGHLIFPMNTLGLHMDNLSQGLEAFRKVRETLDLVDEGERDIALPQLAWRSLSGDIRCENVSFSYPGVGPVLRNITMQFRAGATTAVVGFSGSGKTTLVKLLLRLYTAYSGKIEIDGADIANFSRYSLRQAIAVVSQDVYLFDRSVIDNIRLSRPDATEAEAIGAARLAYAHDFIENLPHGYYTTLGERGAGLSTGERQRISIARAILKDAPILILDEATSSLDSNTEVSVSGAIRRVAAGRTLILISHRLSTVRHADSIYVLENGELIAEGTHRELVRQPGRYQSLWRDQTGRR